MRKNPHFYYRVIQNNRKSNSSYICNLIDELISLIILVIWWLWFWGKYILWVKNRELWHNKHSSEAKCHNSIQCWTRTQSQPIKCHILEIKGDFSLKKTEWALSRHKFPIMLFPQKVRLLSGSSNNYSCLISRKPLRSKIHWVNHCGDSGQATGTKVELYLTSTSSFTE